MEVPGGEPRGRRRQPGRGQRPSPRASTCIFAAGEERLTLFTLSDRRHAPRPRPRHRGRSWRGPRPPLPTCCPDLPGLRARVTGLQCRVCLSATDFKGRCQNKGEFGINNTAARTPEVSARGEQCPARAPVRPEDAGAGDAAGPALRGGRREAPSPGGWLILRMLFMQMVFNWGGGEPALPWAGGTVWRQARFLRPGRGGASVP